MIYICSDWHFSHNKPFIYELRGFPSVGEMNEEIIRKHNEIVKPNDDVYVLGDLMLGDDNIGLECFKRLNGKFHIVRGNHDSDRRCNIYLQQKSVIELQNALYLHYGGYHFYLSHYPTITSNLDYDKPLKQRLLNICGNSHTTDRWMDADKGFIYHAEMDAHNCYPVALDQIFQEFKDKEFVAPSGNT